jgi:glycosyltransferase involved in cell wall biosynthesis
MNQKDLSIIIPCYNCESTLREAVDSCFSQELDNFEIILVDDASKDNTKNIMLKLEDEHEEVKLFFHEKNKGGGATRNTAAQHAEGSVIFCLDSDDILPSRTLSKMFSFMKEKKADAVGIHRSIKFRGANKNDIERIDTFGYVGEKIPFQSLIEKNHVLCPLYSTFMITKEAFRITGGYPTTHGFDTQGFAWRFLMRGLTAYTCPDTEYLHRTHFHESYYLREYNAGKINYNWQQILEEFIVAFTPEIQEHIIHFDIKRSQDVLIKKLVEVPNPWSLHAATMVERKEIDRYMQEPYNMIDEKLYRDMQENSLKLFKPESRSSPVGIGRRGVRKIQTSWSLFRAIIIAREKRWNLIIALLLLKVRKFFKSKYDVSARTDDVVDIVIPTISKDRPLLKQMIEALHENIYHAIGTIYIVSKDSEDMRNFCTEQGYTFIDEVSVLGYGKEAIHYKVNGDDRSGWIFQQLLKLSGEAFVKESDYIIVDSDTLLIRPHVFKSEGKYVFLESEEWHTPYFKAFKKMFGYSSNNTLSYTSHMMIFNCDKLKEMKHALEAKHHVSWDKVYLSTIDSKEYSCVSDYDTYANWVKNNYPDEVTCFPFYNRAFPRTELASLPALTAKYGNRYKSLSFHHYRN